MGQDLVDLSGGHVTEVRAVNNTGLGVTGVDLADGYVEASGDILDGLVALRDDSDTLSDGLGCDWMIAGDHDDLDSSGAAFTDGIRYGSTGRINHGHKTNESQAGEREVLLISVEGVALGVLVSRQHVVTESEHTLSQPPELHVGGVEGLLPLVV